MARKIDILSSWRRKQKVKSEYDGQMTKKAVEEGVNKLPKRSKSEALHDKCTIHFLFFGFSLSFQ
jgi:hypothetical protein